MGASSNVVRAVIAVEENGGHDDTENPEEREQNADDCHNGHVLPAPARPLCARPCSIIALVYGDLGGERENVEETDKVL